MSAFEDKPVMTCCASLNRLRGPETKKCLDVTLNLPGGWSTSKRNAIRSDGKCIFLKATDKKVIFWCGCWITIDIVFPDIFHYCGLIWPTSCIRAILTVWQGQILQRSHKQLFLNCLSPLPLKSVPITAFKYDGGFFFPFDSFWASA